VSQHKSPPHPPPSSPPPPSSSAGPSRPPGYSPGQSLGCPSTYVMAGRANAELEDKLNKERKGIPRLQFKGGDAASILSSLNEWLELTAMILSTWGALAADIWAKAVEEARQNHLRWKAMDPSMRAMEKGMTDPTFALPPSVSLTESTMRIELLSNGTVPQDVVEHCFQKKMNTAVVGILTILFQNYLPAEHSVRLDAMASILTPLSPARNFTDALTTLRSWLQRYRVLRYQLHGEPEPYHLHQLLTSLLGPLTNADVQFSVRLLAITDKTRIRTECTLANFEAYVTLIEAELSERSLEEEEKKRRKTGRPQGFAVEADEDPTACLTQGSKGKGKSKKKGSPPIASPPAPNFGSSSAKGGQKGAGKKGQQPKRDSSPAGRSSKSPPRGSTPPKKTKPGYSPSPKGSPSKGGRSPKSGQRPLCDNFMTDQGCPKGGQCTLYHPTKPGKCLRCGAKWLCAGRSQRFYRVENRGGRLHRYPRRHAGNSWTGLRLYRRAIFLCHEFSLCRHRCQFPEHW